MQITSDAGRIGPFTWINSKLFFTQMPGVRLQMWGSFAWRGQPQIQPQIIAEYI
jgi:hypothetical protein